MTKNNSLKLGYDYDAWHGYGQRDVLFTDISLKTNSHMILCGMSGSGKSYALVWCLKMLILASPPEGSDLHFVKIPTVRDMEKMQEICVKALS